MLRLVKTLLDLDGRLLELEKACIQWLSPAQSLFRESVLPSLLQLKCSKTRRLVVLAKLLHFHDLAPVAMMWMFIRAPSVPPSSMISHNSNVKLCNAMQCVIGAIVSFIHLKINADRWVFVSFYLYIYTSVLKSSNAQVSCYVGDWKGHRCALGVNFCYFDKSATGPRIIT